MAKEQTSLSEITDLRRRAEELLTGNTVAILPPRRDEDALRFYHELQVHQIELEMQNEELMRSREAEEAALNKYSDLYDFAPIGYFTLGSNGDIRDANLTGTALLGVERSRLIGRRFEYFVPQKDRLAFAEFLSKILACPARKACEVTLLKEGNSPFFVRIDAVAAASGQECRIALIDITERKLAEEALRQSAERLRLSHQAAKIGAFEWNVQTGVNIWTPELEAMYGLAPGEFGKTQPAWEQLLHPEDRAAAVALVNQTFETGEPVKGEWRVVWRDGSVHWISGGFQLFKDATGKPHCLSGVNLDITERKLTEEALRKAKEGAEAANSAKSQFLANMSHELRTPMTGILGMLQLALQEEISPAVRDYLDTTLTSARSLLGVLNDILIMTKIEGGQLSIAEKPFTLKKCITEAVDLIIPEVRRKGLDFVLSGVEEAPETVVGDESRLRQVLLNLIGNAVKFTEGGKVEVRVSTSGTTSAGRCEFTFAVTDTGIGIPDDKKELLFRAFSQIDGSHSRSYGGTGLGLAISREIVELMGGTISFESKEGVGSTFSCTIPLMGTGLNSDALPTAASLSPEMIFPVTGGEKIPRVLHVDDDPIMRRIFGLMLKRSNYNIDFAEDGLKAVEMWEQGGYDLVLMDVQMPGLNGFEATRAIREKERPRGGHTTIIAMTAHAGKEDDEKCLAAGMDAYISKPFDFKACLEVIEDTLKRAGLVR